MKTWDDIFLAALRRGDDHGYAAYLADAYVKRKRKMRETPLTWLEPRRVDVWWWMQMRVLDDAGNVAREGTVAWNADGTGYYDVFISFEREGVGLHCWPDFYALSDAQDFVERLMGMSLEAVLLIHGTQWPGVVL